MNKNLKKAVRKLEANIANITVETNPVNYDKAAAIIEKRRAKCSK